MTGLGNAIGCLLLSQLEERSPSTTLLMPIDIRRKRREVSSYVPMIAASQDES